MMRLPNNGFTTIEMLVVVFVLALAVVVAGVGVYYGFSKAYTYEKLNKGCRDVSNWITRMQNECVMNRRNMQLVYDIDNSIFKVNFQYESGMEETGEGDDFSEAEDQEWAARDLPEGVKIREVSLDPYNTYYNGTVSILIRKDGWITPHILQLCVDADGDEIEDRVYTLEVVPLTGVVYIHTDKLSWQDIQ